MSPKKNNKKYGMVLGIIVSMAFAVVVAFDHSPSGTTKAHDNGGQAQQKAYTRQDVYYNGDYYNELEGLDNLLNGKYSDKDIKEGLRALIGYQSATTYVEGFGKNITGTDEKHPRYKGVREGSLAYVWQESERMENDQERQGNFRLFYSNVYGTTLDDYSTTVNREHVWPQSLSGGLFGTSGAGADGHHISPANSKLNGARSNKRYGDLKNDEIENTYFATDGAKSFNCLYDYFDESYVNNNYRGHITGYSTEDVFEPRDDYKGDIARIIAYMALHYEQLENIVDNVMVGGYDTIVEWNRLDPVDEYEINRNNVIAEFQGNRNPFIDAPGLVDILYADDVDVLASNSSNNLIHNPVINSLYNLYAFIDCKRFVAFK